ncbi:glycoside hydrolase family 5 protein [Micromonospora antibiotica]|uniref:cellulase n=1 Tax=Micromonospora antibiotica TaxID=2807623 RepID=A0ABS3V3U1_9ACTN|nr:glycoside hydrolase family 5 protein [Micromonospora antibiotica]MBO4160282.1 glycoside hydrolase family 5 protein [Micromonospora antibiotica]
MHRRAALTWTGVALAALVTGWAALAVPTASADTEPAPPATAGPVATDPTTGTTGPPATATDGPTAGPATAPAGSPVAVHGRLRVCGVNLCDEAGEPVQLRGMSSHGLQFFPNCLNPDSLAALRTDWQADFVRVAMYVQEGGFETDPAGFTRRVDEAVATASALGLYVVVDFHILTPGDPRFNLERAQSFFADVAARHAERTNVLWEIANEPNGVGWADIKSYAEQVIPVIRAADPDSVVLVGTRGFSSLGVSEGADETEVIDDPVDATNIMYTFHFYAASHRDLQRATVARAARSLPLFVSEFGTQTFTGDGPNDLDSATTWLDLLKSLKISYAMWSFSDGPESNSVFRRGTCAGTDFTGTAVLTESGEFIRSRIRG